jgi:ATP adenylyltransferase
VLNKFPIIKEHFILATKDNKAQTHLLEAIDLEATYACMKSWESSDYVRGRMFAFFNSGDHSGASQPHRHIQLLPLESMRDGDATDDWSLLIDILMSSAHAQVEGM